MESLRGNGVGPFCKRYCTSKENHAAPNIFASTPATAPLAAATAETAAAVLKLFMAFIQITTL